MTMDTTSGITKTPKVSPSRGAIRAGPAAANASPEITVVLNWHEELKRLVPVD